MSSHKSSRPPSWDIGRTGVKALAAFAVLIAGVAAVLAWHGRPAVQPVAPAGPAPLASVPAVRTSAATTIVVAVSGRVQHPGLVRLPTGSRVADAIDAAGGVLPGTDTSTLNLARKVSDGELIAVGVPGAAADPASGSAAVGGGQVDLNTATLEQLETLPGVGPVLAQRILDYRDQHGTFTAIDQLRQVSGIGDAKFNDLKNRVTV